MRGNRSWQGFGHRKGELIPASPAQPPQTSPQKATPVLTAASVLESSRSPSQAYQGSGLTDTTTMVTGPGLDAACLPLMIWTTQTP